MRIKNEASLTPGPPRRQRREGSGIIWSLSSWVVDQVVSSCYAGRLRRCFRPSGQHHFVSWSSGSFYWLWRSASFGVVRELLRLCLPAFVSPGLGWPSSHLHCLLLRGGNLFPRTLSLVSFGHHVNNVSLAPMLFRRSRYDIDLHSWRIASECRRKTALISQGLVCSL